ncbi:succinate-semialdehyde dehydrogenase/glutarate-semialdehyde dehydrogenase [Anseongella ginsenosidimutans]|uniref:Succinate-semialdehyde dehydrogenase/glutarate-semialdehyde dehydrogenase n=2 Tax=Anseongella ginsenosidimutans TaxID=496056 RepID=A0A4R3KPQ9_9SPHI|nr:NAD-dependent succinate-semialdehyde dehydrogenase [Anseongella ginsenosidimutans]TCS86372.1 succinate-semialdehyde dehydrogenase/glutarate-semialdehyde dehydrogenase [Anseongella ginsenosidimutans]
MAIESVNPLNGKRIKKYPVLKPGQVSRKVKAAQDAFLNWKETGFPERSALFKKAASVLEKKKDALARLMALEMGKPLAQGASEIDKCAWVCKYYSEEARGFLLPEKIATDASKSYVAFEPLGVVLAIMPWNFPFWQVFRFAAPSLMAGNTGLLKHASNVPGCALAIEDIFKEAGFPPGVFQSLLIDSGQAAAVMEDERVKAVTLTGSTQAGKSVASKAGSLLKKTVLELGGSDPYLILEDADLEKAAEICVNGRLVNSGQSCIAAKRFIVVKAVEKRFLELFRNRMMDKKMGDPLQEDTDIGPQAREDLRDQLHEQVLESIVKGARCLLGGKKPEGKGAFYPATILTNVKKGMPAYDEELFGPVAAVITAKDEDDAIKKANDSSFGLGAAVFTKDKKRGEQLAAHRLEAGSCFVNGIVHSDPRLPFGGIKESGYGRELGGFGIREFVNIKTVYVT